MRLMCMSKVPETVSAWMEEERGLYEYNTGRPGYRLLVLGCLHGDERCGYYGSERVIDDIRSGRLALTKGSLTLIPKCNPMAFARNRRFVDKDLNRSMRNTEKPAIYEELIANRLIPLMRQHDVLLDIHAFRAVGRPFVFIGPENNRGAVEPFKRADEELFYAMSLGVETCVFGWLPAYYQFVEQQNSFIEGLEQRQIRQIARANGGLGVGATETFRKLGGYAVTVECGNLSDPTSYDVAYTVIRRALAALHLCNEPPSTKPFRKTLRISQVLLRKSKADSFAKDWKLFDSVEKGSPLAQRETGETLVAQSNGAVIFTYPDARPGEAWMYFAHESARGTTVPANADRRGMS
jgi:uncharacterized protein